MTDSLLNILKFALLALLYLFFARVLWAVWSEVRGPRKETAVAPPMVQRRVATRRPAPAAEPIDEPSGATERPAKQPRAPRAPRGVVSRLVVLEPKANKGAALNVAQEITFGRAPGCTVSVPDDSYVSQVHARVYSDQGNVFAEDLGSTNGTYVNGNRLIAPVQLQRGDRLQIGSTVLEAG